MLSQGWAKIWNCSSTVTLPWCNVPDSLLLRGQACFLRPKSGKPVLLLCLAEFPQVSVQQQVMGNSIALQVQAKALALAEVFGFFQQWNFENVLTKLIFNKNFIVCFGTRPVYRVKLYLSLTWVYSTLLQTCSVLWTALFAPHTEIDNHC